MIRIEKPAQAPEVLRTRGAAECTALCEQFEQDPDGYQCGTAKFDFQRSIYGNDAVKTALSDAQHGKCCFCESKIHHISFGDVEHFRPKAGYRQQGSDDLQRPGYYWLAHAWSNLFISCELCNRRHKGNHFPLQNPTRRATSHKADLGLEKPLFIDPSTIDPEKHISFRQEVPYAIADGPMGRETIKALRLDRDQLNEMRWDRYKMLETLYLVATRSPPIPETAEARSHLERAVLDSAPYASMVRAALARGFSNEPVSPSLDRHEPKPCY